MSSLRRLLVLYALSLLAAPPAARASVHLLDVTLALPGVVALAADAEGQRSGPSQKDGDKSKPEESHPAQEGAARPPSVPPTAKPGSLDFDLLGAPRQVERVDEGALRLRRTLLTVHQGVGLGMFALQLATTVLGQLNYSDKFGGDNTGKYVLPHAVLAYSTLGAFVAAGTLALLAPRPFEREGGFDRTTLHKIAMFTAAGGMLAQGVLGIWTRTREGYLDQQTIGTVHLAIGYFTLAAVATGVGAILL